LYARTKRTGARSTTAGAILERKRGMAHIGRRRHLAAFPLTTRDVLLPLFRASPILFALHARVGHGVPVEFAPTGEEFWDACSGSVISPRRSFSACLRQPLRGIMSTGGGHHGSVFAAERLRVMEASCSSSSSWSRVAVLAIKSKELSGAGRPLAVFSGRFCGLGVVFLIATKYCTRSIITCKLPLWRYPRGRLAGCSLPPHIARSQW